MDIAFWMVWRAGGNAPMHQHQSEDSANKEADRLAREVGGEFFVLRALRSFKRVSVIVTELEDPANLPF